MSYSQTEDELINDLNMLKKENRKKAEEKTAKTNKAVANMFGAPVAKKTNMFG